MKRARSPGEEPTQPVFRWEESYGQRVGLTRAEAARGAFVSAAPLALPPCCAAPARAAALAALVSSLLPATPHSISPAVTPGGAPFLRRDVWLPPSLDRPSGVAFPGVRLGNRLFIYCAARLSAMLAGRDFSLLTPHPLLAGLADKVPYGGAGALRVECVGGCPACAAAAATPVAGGAAAAPDRAGALEGTPVSAAAGSAVCDWVVRSAPGVLPSSPLFCPPLPLQAFLAAQGDHGRAWVQSQPSCGAAGSLLQPFAPLLAMWLQPFLIRAYTGSLRASPALGGGEGDWVVHVRTGDIWDERRCGGGGGGGSARTAVNAAAPAYVPPPAWWYAAAAAHFGIRRAWVVTERASSSLVAAVARALAAGGASTVALVSGTEEGDFGTLLRARNLILSVSTYAWWGAMMAPFAPAVVGRTAARVSAEEAAAFVPGAPVRVVVPRSGMLRPGSIHGVHADLSLKPHGAVPWWDTTAGAERAAAAESRPLRVTSAHVWDDTRAAALETYKCTEEEAAWVLESVPPPWAAAAASEELWEELRA
jgi:hypothetical protein